MHVVQPLYYSCLEQASVGAQGHTTSTAAKMHVIQPLYYSCFKQAGVGAQGHTTSTATKMHVIQPLYYSCFERAGVGAYRIRPPRQRTFQQKSLSQNDASFANTFAAVVFIFAHIRAYALAPLRFSCDAETIVFSHLDLRDCFTIKIENTNGEPSSAGRQWCFRNRESWFENRTKYICHLRNEDYFLRKTAIAFAEMKLSLAQNGYRNRDNEIVTCANPHRNRDNEIVTCANVHRNRDSEIVTCANPHRNRDSEIVTCANPHRNRDNEIVPPTLVLRQTRWDFAHQGEPYPSLAMKAMQAKQQVGSKCEGTLRTLYMTLFHARYTHNQNGKDDQKCDN